MSDVLSSIFVNLALYTSFLTTKCFQLLDINGQEQISIYEHLIYLLYFSNYLNQLVYFSIYQYLIDLHKILNFLNHFFQQKMIYHILLNFLDLFLLHNYRQILFNLLLKNLVLENIHSFVYAFFIYPAIKRIIVSFPFNL